jgi:hypothetical protein
MSISLLIISSLNPPVLSFEMSNFRRHNPTKSTVVFLLIHFHPLSNVSLLVIVHLFLSLHSYSTLLALVPIKYIYLRQHFFDSYQLLLLIRRFYLLYLLYWILFLELLLIIFRVSGVFRTISWCRWRLDASDFSRLFKLSDVIINTYISLLWLVSNAFAGGKIGQRPTLSV